MAATDRPADVQWLVDNQTDRITGYIAKGVEMHPPAFLDTDASGNTVLVGADGGYLTLTGMLGDANHFMPPTAVFQSALGSTQATAKLITKSVFHVSVATGATAEGLILPAPDTLAVGTQFTIINGTDVTLKVYPATGGQINWGGVNVPQTMAGYSNITLMVVDPGAGLYVQIG